MNSASLNVPPRLPGLRSSQPALLIVGFALAAGLGILFLFDPARHAFYPRCQFHAMTGLYCPGCGSLRALHQLLHGHIGAALRFNALLVMALPVAMGILVSRVLRMWAGKNSNARQLTGAAADGDVRAPVVPIWVWVGFGSLIVFGIVRNLPFDCFSCLRP
jgi:hypothetical protein